MNITELISPVKILVLLTFIFVLCFFNKRIRTQNLLFLLVLLTALFEIISAVLKIAHIPRHFPATIFVCLHTLLWLAIFYTITSRKSLINSIVILYLILTVINFLLLDEQDIFRYTFVFGAILYLVAFLYDSFMELKNENLGYFTSHNYMLIGAPVLFFIGFSLIFAFKERQIGEVKITDFITLYDFTSYLVNIVYYTLVNVYIYKVNTPHRWNTI